MTASVTHRKTDLHPSLLLLNLECPRVPGKPERRGGSGSFRKAQEGPALVSLLHVLRLGPWDPTIFHGCLVWRVELVGDNGDLAKESPAQPIQGILFPRVLDSKILLHISNSGSIYSLLCFKKKKGFINGSNRPRPAQGSIYMHLHLVVSLLLFLCHFLASVVSTL
ncbi:Protein Phosphatase 2C-Like Domain-Containing Protein 1 [Manis pentadactyla]|nr:Protein Phosphatase 2C-Like Domain-Containing Protein 1 [Manis pentadactyla]